MPHTRAQCGDTPCIASSYAARASRMVHPKRCIRPPACHTAARHNTVALGLLLACHSHRFGDFVRGFQYNVTSLPPLDGVQCVAQAAVAANTPGTLGTIKATNTPHQPCCMTSQLHSLQPATAIHSLLPPPPPLAMLRISL